MGDDRSDDPWSPDSDVSFERQPTVPFESENRPSSSVAGADPRLLTTDTAEPPAGRLRRRAVVAAIAAMAAAATATAVLLSSDSGGESARAPDLSVVALPESLPAPDRTLDEIRRDEVPGAIRRGAPQRDTGDDVVLGVGDVPLTAGQRECLLERLPDSVDVRWSVDVEFAGVEFTGEGAGEAAAANGLVFVHTRNAGPGDPRADARLVVLDEANGLERWRTEIDGVGEHVRVSGVVDGVVIVESFPRRDMPFDAVGSKVIALSADSGEELWRNDVENGVQMVLDPVRSRLIAHQTVERDDDPPEVIAFGVTTGEESWRHPGVLGDVGSDGSVAVIGPTEIVWEADWTARFDLIEPDTRSAVVVGATLVVVHGGSRALTAFERGADRRFGYRPLRITGSAGIDPPEAIGRVHALGGNSLIVEADGATYGANISGGTVELRWRKRGGVVGIEPSDRGLVVQIERDGAIGYDVVDASTGRTIVESSTAQAAPPGLHANGVTVTDFGDGDGPQIVRGLDLDGRERWTLTRAAAPAVGDRVVVDVATDPGRAGFLTVTAYGPVVDGPPQCGTIMREWVTS